jgi:hypothetical protein
MALTFILDYSHLNAHVQRETSSNVGRHYSFSKQQSRSHKKLMAQIVLVDVALPTLSLYLTHF